MRGILLLAVVAVAFVAASELNADLFALKQFNIWMAKYQKVKKTKKLEKEKTNLVC